VTRERLRSRTARPAPQPARGPALKRSRIETALLESEARFAKVFHASPVPLGMSTIADGRIIDVNDSWLELFGYRRDEVIGRTNRELNLAVDQGARAAIIERVRADGVVHNLETQVRRKSGEILDLILSAVPVDLGGEVEAWLVAQVSITDRKRVEAERDRLLASATAAKAEAEGALERLRAIQSITDSAVAHLSLDAMLRELLARLRRALHADFALVQLVDDERQLLYVRLVDGRAHERVATMRIPLGKGISGVVAQTGQPRIIDDLSSVDFMSGLDGVPAKEMLAVVQSSMVAPLEVEGRIIGVVSVGAALPRRFTSEGLELLLVVADRVAPAIEGARLMETLHAAQERSEALSRRLVQLQETERASIAGELHDEVGQLLTGLGLMIKAGEPAFSRDQMTEVVVELIGRVRDLSMSLRPPMLDSLGLVPALVWQVGRFQAQTGIAVDLRHLGLDRRFPPDIEIAVFRIVQEALTNVARHAQVQRAKVEVAAEGGRLRVGVEDEGCGFDLETALLARSSGLAGMRERCRLVGGRLTIRAAAGNGTRVQADLPLRGDQLRE
jgi:PAS domain S-box-containing protein